MMNDKFSLKCAEMRLQLHEVDRTIERIQTAPIVFAEGARSRAEDRMGTMGDLIAANLEEVRAAEAKVEAWVDHGRPAAAAQVPGWKVDGRTHDLKEHADDAEAYAMAVLELAAAAARECAHAVLEAVLARADADYACMPPAGRLPAPVRSHATEEATR